MLMNGKLTKKNWKIVKYRIFSNGINQLLTLKWIDHNSFVNITAFLRKIILSFEIESTKRIF